MAKKVNYMINESSVSFDIPEEEVLKIRTGRTTALALKAIAEALENPDTAVALMDHNKDYSDLSSTTVMTCRVGRIIDALGLQRMSIAGDVPMFLTFNPYTKMEAD